MELVMNDRVNALVRRAYAEGYTPSQLTAAAERIQTREVESVRTGVVAADPTPETVEEMARRIARCALYCGGYMYRGTEFSHGLSGHQPHEWSRVGDSSPASEVGVIITVLLEIPVGEMISETTSHGNGVRVDYYLRTETGFTHTAYSDTAEEEFLRRCDYRTPQAVARELNVACSNTLVELLRYVLR